MANSILFLTLKIFSDTGGIEKVCRIAGKVLTELDAESPGTGVKVFSMYDGSASNDEKYIPAGAFRGFGRNKPAFVLAACRAGIKSRQVIISHINLLLPAFLIKIGSPSTRLILIAHGIEVWQPFSPIKKYMLGKCYQVLAVSNFTKEKMMAVHGIPAHRISVLNNCLDPFLPLPIKSGVKDAGLLRRYGLDSGEPLLLTITRLSFAEQYKGYDQVFRALRKLKDRYPGIRYLLAGKYDVAEKRRIDALVSSLGLEDTVILPGFIPEDELAAHYDMADCYIMPSKKEGFGIVFIEALYYGKPVIAGNRDGSVDALDKGSLGQLVNPDDLEEITTAIKNVLDNKQAHLPNHELVLKKFSYEVYKEKWRIVLGDIVSKAPSPASLRVEEKALFLPESGEL